MSAIQQKWGLNCICPLLQYISLRQEGILGGGKSKEKKYQEQRKKKENFEKKELQKKIKGSRKDTTYVEEAKTKQKSVLRRNYRRHRSGSNTVFGEGRGYIRFSTDV